MLKIKNLIIFNWCKLCSKFDSLLFQLLHYVSLGKLLTRMEQYCKTIASCTMIWYLWLFICLKRIPWCDVKSSLINYYFPMGMFSMDRKDNHPKWNAIAGRATRKGRPRARWILIKKTMHYRLTCSKKEVIEATKYYEN